jgi:Bacterial SH3 domain
MRLVHRNPLQRNPVIALLAGVAALVVAACGSTNTTTGNGNGVATNPASLPNGGAFTSASAGGTGSAAQTSGIRTVLAPLGLNLRDADAPTGKVLGTAAQGTVFSVVGHSDNNGGWYHVKGDTTSGWITANPLYTSAHRFTLYQSQQHGFNVLYLENWTFAENPASTVFRPQSGGGQAIVVRTAQTLDQLGAAGIPGYTLASTDTVEVFGVTANLRVFSRTGSVAPSPGADQPPPLAHLAEIRLTIDSSRAMRLDFGYDISGDISQFTDFYNSMSFPPPGSPGASPSPSSSAVATASPL